MILKANSFSDVKVYAHNEYTARCFVKFLTISKHFEYYWSVGWSRNLCWSRKGRNGMECWSLNWRNGI